MAHKEQIMGSPPGEHARLPLQWESNCEELLLQKSYKALKAAVSINHRSKVNKKAPYGAGVGE